MAKPEWGTKRICQSCGARFYDLLRDPPTCPGCGAVAAGKPAAKLKRPPAAALEETAPVVNEAPPTTTAAVEKDLHEGAEEELDEEDEILDGDSNSEDTDNLNENEEDDSLIEDTSELGEDDDDMSEVMEHIDDDDLSDRS